jgi:protein-disulfide isomerase
MDENVTKPQADSVEVKKSTLIAVVAVIAIFIIGFYLGGAFNIGGVAPNGGDNGGSTTEESFVENTPLLVSLDDDDVMGNEGAAISIIEFSDYNCPFCGKFFKETVAPLKQNYVNTGKVNFVHRDYPIDKLLYHENTFKYAQSTECAAEQDKFWEMHDALYQENLDFYAALQAGENPENFTIDKIRRNAEAIGLDMDLFNTCLDTDATLDEVAADLQAGASYGVGGTPATFIIVNKELDAAKLAELNEMGKYVWEQTGKDRKLMMTYVGSGTTTVMIGGAFPYEIFQSVLDLMA